MRLTLRDDQQATVAAFEDLFRKEAPSERVRAAEPLGFDAALWRSLVEVGAPGIAVPADAGGAGATLLDAALVAEQLGRRVAPAPLVAASVAARVLARATVAGAAEDLGGRCWPAEPSVALALRPAHDGVAALVPWGAVADAVVALDGDELVLAAPRRPAVAPLRLGRRGAGRRAGRRRIGRRAAGSCWRRDRRPHASAAVALDEWRALQSAVLVGVAAEALAQAVAYAKERHQFGRPIGSFQALAHGLVDAATAVDGARLLAVRGGVGGRRRPRPLPGAGVDGVRVRGRHGAARDRRPPCTPTAARASWRRPTCSCTTAGPGRGRSSTAPSPASSATWPRCCGDAAARRGAGAGER